MKHISILKQASKEFIEAFAVRHNLTRYLEDYSHPQEDYLIANEDEAIFVVSDGVTLNYEHIIKKNGKYPNPSPAGEVSRIFCEGFIKYAKELKGGIDGGEILEVFKKANKEVAKYNNVVGKSEISGNQTGYFSATGAFVVIRGGRVYWGTICDSFVAHFDKDMNLKFFSSGKCSPYAVINGEEKMTEYLEKGVLTVSENDRVLVFTDGFENYVRDEKFTKLFRIWDETLEKRIHEFSEQMSRTFPEKYGHERSLISVLI